MDDRGKIKNRDRARQLVDFQELRWGKITPTDLDGFIDFGNNAFVCIEYKYQNAPIGYGQGLAFERLVNLMDAMGKPCILIHATHEQHDPDKDIDGANAIVAQTYYKGKWNPDGKRTVKQVVDYFLDKIALSNH